LSTKQDYDCIAFGRDEAEEKDILDTTVVAFECCLSELVFRMETDFLVARANKVVDDVRTGRAATGVAEPFVAGKTFDDAAGRMDAAVTTHLLAWSFFVPPFLGRGSRGYARTSPVGQFCVDFGQGFAVFLDIAVTTAMSPRDKSNDTRRVIAVDL
jgi:hypothetical protein